MNGPKLVTASFSNKPVLTVTKAGSGSGSVSSSPGGIDCGSDCSEPYNAGTTVTLTATPANAASTFAGWSGGGCTGTGACVVTMDASKLVTATFDDVLQDLTVTVSGDGTITSDVGGISCPGTCAASYAPGTTVVLTATLGATATVVVWGDDCAAEVDLDCSLTMDSSKSVSATFA
jgi:hypothetical protein